MDSRSGILSDRVVRYAATPEVAWRNGNGVTRELHTGDGWRLSVATIAAAGEFSAFPGVDRTFVLARGEVEICIDGICDQLAVGQLRHFAGEAQVWAKPLTPNTYAINVMTERGCCEAAVTVEEMFGRLPECDALVLLSGTVVLDDGQSLATLDALLRAPGGVAHGVSARAVVITVRGTNE